MDFSLSPKSRDLAQRRESVMIERELPVKRDVPEPCEGGVFLAMLLEELRVPTTATRLRKMPSLRDDPPGTRLANLHCATLAAPGRAKPYFTRNWGASA